MVRNSYDVITESDPTWFDVCDSLNIMAKLREYFDFPVFLVADNEMIADERSETSCAALKVVLSRNGGVDTPNQLKSGHVTGAEFQWWFRSPVEFSSQCQIKQSDQVHREKHVPEPNIRRMLLNGKAGNVLRLKIF
ncbi:hypothetical protein DPMN_051839 [Dreissena polymorpha]|uniref:Uncharacterized protein n=1 Tax=Dreissena polymorpha TaxID=45954 RepID=A0A9D4CJV6_DREPO|nr:hypothetical protein DPMN_051839 [Dreissena polymorpha]